MSNTFSTPADIQRHLDSLGLFHMDMGLGRMITCPADELAKAARNLAKRLRKGLNADSTLCEIGLREDVSRVGGGAFPQYDLPTTLVRLRPTA